jgi:tetratricopeptide (TPR) repeat protein
MRKSLLGFMVLTGLVFAAASARADVVDLGGIKYADVKIDKIVGDEIYYTTSNGEVHKTITDRMRLTITSEPSFNDAESAFATQKWADAADGYQKVLNTTSKAWLKDFAASRLQRSSEKAGRFDTAVSAWIYAVTKDPANAAKAKPTPPPDPSSTFIKTAEQELAAAATAAQSEEVRQAMYLYELDLARYQKDDATIAAVAAQLTKMGALNPATLLGLIHLDLDAKRYKEAQQKLSQLKGPLPDPAQENDRLFCLAEVANFTADPQSPASTWQDIALSYMRVVANNPNGPVTALALLRVAQLHEKFNDAATARNIYVQIQKDYKDAPDQKSVVEEAKKSLERLAH